MSVEFHSDRVTIVFHLDNFEFLGLDVPAIVVELEQPGFNTSTRQGPRAIHRIGPPGVR